MIGWWLLWGLVVAVVAWQTRHALRWPLERDRIIAAAHASTEQLIGTAPVPDTGDEWVYDGPDSLQLLEDADRHLDQCAAADARLSGAFGQGAPIPDLTTHPDFDAGCDRLWDAIREHREEES